MKALQVLLLVMLGIFLPVQSLVDPNSKTAKLNAQIIAASSALATASQTIQTDVTALDTQELKILEARLGAVGSHPLKPLPATDFDTLISQYVSILGRYQKAYADYNTAAQSINKARVGVTGVNPVPVYSYAFMTKDNAVAQTINNLVTLFMVDIDTTIEYARDVRNRLLKGEKNLSINPYTVVYDLMTKVAPLKNDGTSCVDTTKGFEQRLRDVVTAIYPTDKVQQDAIFGYYLDNLEVVFDDIVSFMSELSREYRAPGKDQKRFGDLSWQDVARYADTFYCMLDAKYHSPYRPQPKDAVNQMLLESAAQMGDFFVRAASAQLNTMGDQLRTSGKQNKQNTSLLQTYFSKASFYYTKSGAKYSDIANSFATYYSTLGSAMALQEKADEATDSATKIDLYQQAVTDYQNVGDAADAGFVENLLLELIAGEALKSAKNIFQNFLTAQTTDFVAFATGVSTVPTDKGELTDMAVLTNLVTACNQVIPLYQSMIDSYEKLDRSVSLLDTAADFLITFTKAYTHLQDGLAATLGKDQADFVQALQVVDSADRTYSKDIAIVSYAPWYPAELFKEKTAVMALLQSGQAWTLGTLFRRIIAKRYILAADNLTDDPFTAYGYYTYAQKINMLSPTMNGYVTIKLGALHLSLDDLKAQFTKLQALEELAKNYTSADWSGDVSASTAYQGWNNVVAGYLNLYKLGHVPAATAYVTALEEFAQHIMQNVTADGYPSIHAALLYYNAMLFQGLHPDQFDAAQKKNAVDQFELLATNFFTTLQSLVTAVASPDKLAQALSNQAKIMQMDELLETILVEQSEILNALNIAAADRASHSYISKTADATKKTTTYAVQFPDRDILQVVAPDKYHTIAQIYVALGQDATKQKDFVTAYANYAQAKIYYERSGDVDTLKLIEPAYQTARTLAYGQSYLQSYQSIGSVAVPTLGLSVAQSYQVLLTLLQDSKSPVTIPSVVNTQLGTLRNLKIQLQQAVAPEQKDSLTQQINAILKQIQNELLDIAQQMYLWKMVQDSSNDLSGYTYEEIMNALKTKNFDIFKNAENSDVVISNLNRIVGYAVNLVDTYAPQIAQGNLVMGMTKTNDIKLYNFPTWPVDVTIAGVTTPLLSQMEQLPYTNFPTPFLYNKLALQFFMTGTGTFTYGTPFVYGNNQELYNATLEAMAENLLSLAVEYQAIIDYMYGITSKLDPSITGKKLTTAQSVRAKVKELQALSEQDRSKANLKDIYPHFVSMQAFVASLVELYDAARAYFEIGNNSRHSSDLKKLSGRAIRKFVDFVRKTMLIGDPSTKNGSSENNQAFGDMVQTISEGYLAAAQAYGVIEEKEAYLEAAELYKHGGDLIYQAGNIAQAADFVGSFYKTGLQWARSYTKADTEVRQKTVDIQTAWAQAQFEFATQKFAQYGAARAATNVDNSGKTLAQIIATGLTDPSNCTYNKYQDLLLTGNIYYFIVQMGLGNVETQLDLAGTSTTIIAKEATDVVNNYKIKQKITLDKVSDFITLLGSGSFQAVALKAYQDLLVAPLSSTASSFPVGAQKAVRYQAAAQWAGLLMTQGAALFDQDFAPKKFWDVFGPAVSAKLADGTMYLGASC